MVFWTYFFSKKGVSLVFWASLRAEPRSLDIQFLDPIVEAVGTIGSALIEVGPDADPLTLPSASRRRIR